MRQLEKDSFSSLISFSFIVCSHFPSSLLFMNQPPPILPNTQAVCCRKVAKLFDCYTAGRLPFQHSQDPSTACLTQGLGDLGLWPAFAFCFCLFTANSSLFDHPLIQASCLAGGPIRDWGQVPPTNGRWWSVRLAARRGWRATWCLGGSLLASSYLELTPKPLKMVSTTKQVFQCFWKIT